MGASLNGRLPESECVVNVSEGRDRAVVSAVAAAGGDAVLDVHSDADHHRSVITLGGALPDVERAARAVVATAVARIDLGGHDGAHPRLGAADVVPVVPLAPGDAAWAAAVDTRDQLAVWIGDVLGVPCFLYGPERTLPEVRRAAFRGLSPDTGPRAPHPTAGATAVGVRRPLVAYNLWLEAAAPRVDDVLAVARELAASVRGPAVRALGLPVGSGAQVSCNLLETTGAALLALHDAVAAGASQHRCRLIRAELVGLAPAAALEGIPRRRWAEVGVGEERTIERRWAVTSAGARPEGEPPSGPAPTPAGG